MPTDEKPIESRPARAEVTNEARLQAVLAGMLDAVITIDDRGSIQDASDSVEAIFGYTPGELSGENIKLIMPEPHRGDHDGHLAKYRDTRVTTILNTTREFDVVHKDGHVFPVELSISRIELPGTTPDLFCGTFRDITERKAAEAALADSEARFRAIFDQEFQFVGLLRPDGVVLEINQTALDAIGAERSSVVGKHFWETPWWAQAKHSREELNEMIKRAAEGQLVRTQVEFVTNGDRQRTVDFSLKPTQNSSGEIALIIAEGRDITELQRVQKRETAMLKALATVGESAAVLAHEIKNPITAVNLALRAVADKLGEDQEEVLTDLVKRMQTLEAMMRRTLSFVRPLELRQERAQILEVVRDAVELVSPELENNQISVTLPADEDDATVYVDQLLFSDVFTNLICNASDAIESGGRISVEVAHPSQRQVTLHFDDDGPGIPESIETDLFKPFMTTKKKGSGIGLALCRRIVEEHDGELAAGESPLGGARFSVTLPLAP